MECSCGNRTFPANCIRIKKKLQLHSLLKWVVRCGVENGWVGGAIRPECQKTMGKSIFFLVGCQIRGVYRAISFLTHLLLQFAFVIILDKNMSTVILRKVQKRRSSHFRRKAV